MLHGCLAEGWFRVLLFSETSYRYCQYKHSIDIVWSFGRYKFGWFLTLLEVQK